MLTVKAIYLWMGLWWQYTKVNNLIPFIPNDNTLGQNTACWCLLPKVSMRVIIPVFYNYEMPVKSDNPCPANFIPEVYASI